MTIQVLKTVTKREIDNLVRLMTQLRRATEKQRSTLAEVRAILGSKNVKMLVIKEKGHIVGVGTLYIIQKVGRREAHVDDVVVDSAYRGRGLGTKLMRALIQEARRYKVRSVDLTSSPERKAANKLYLKIGFKLRKTNPYTLRL